jgi:hypothetical protein
MPSERRSQVRHRTNIETLWTSTSRTSTRSIVRIRDICRTGAQFEVSDPVCPGDRVRIELLTIVEGQVVYVHPTPEGKWIVGCKFDRELSEQEMKMLVRK